MDAPMYRQIADDLRRQIGSGELVRGARLSTDLELSEHYAVSKNTVRDAIRSLIRDGLLEARAGVGTFVARRIEPYITNLSPDPRVGVGAGGEEPRTYPTRVQQGKGRPTTPRVEVMTCPPDIAARLKIAPDSQVISRSQERKIDDVLWSLQSSYYPLEWGTSGASKLLIAEDIAHGTIMYLAETLGLLQAGYEDTLTARPASDNEKQLFGLSPAAAMFVIYRTAYTKDKIATRVTVTVCPADRNQFRYNYGIVPIPEQDPRWDSLDY